MRNSAAGKDDKCHLCGYLCRLWGHSIKFSEEYPVAQMEGESASTSQLTWPTLLLGPAENR